MALTTARDITVCSKEFQERHPRLYHYTSRAGLEGIVGSRTMRATDYRSLNNFSEIIHLKKPFTESQRLCSAASSSSVTPTDNGGEVLKLLADARD